MPETVKPKGIQISRIAKEVNRQSAEILEYLKHIGVEATSVMSKVDEEIYKKILRHFRKDLEEAEKHKQKLIEIKKKHKGIEISEIDEEIRKEEEKKQKEEEERKKKELEEERLKLERERRLEIELEEKRKKIIETQEKSEQEIISKETKPKQGDDLTDKLSPEDSKKPKKLSQKIQGFVMPPSPVYKTPAKQTQKKKEDKPKKPEAKTNKPPKFERVTIKDDSPRIKKKPYQTPFTKKSSTSRSVSTKDDSIKPAETQSIEDKEKKRDIEKKEKSRKYKYSDGTDSKKKLKRIEDEEDVQEAIRETLAKMDTPAITSRQQLKRKKKKERIEQKQIEEQKALEKQNVLQVTEYLSTSELAALMGIDVSALIQKSFALGTMITINQRLDKDIITLLADDFGYKVEFNKEYEVDVLADTEDPAESLVTRPPVVTIMGHVDHGKTSLLDYIRKTNVVAGEAGGITQHIGAYQVKLDEGKLITFLDTPGHEAFTAMRARGAQITDIVVLVVAADDSVMPQTVEAINHALAAGVPIIVAINKIDKPGADPLKIKTQLSEKGILVEEWGGKYQSVEISAKTGKNIDQLLEKILVEAELLELKANPSRRARGVVVEAKLDRGRGIVATVLVQKGTLKTGDSFVAGNHSGKVKAMFDERGHRIEVAKPSTPVQLLGFDGMPQAGDTLVVLDSEKEAREIALRRRQITREQQLRQTRLITLDDISKEIKEGKQVDLNVIIKGDVDGSVEALSDSLLKLGSDEVKVNIIHKAVGEISEQDVSLAIASKAIIVGFNVRPNLKARKLAQTEKVDIRLHNIIYDVINEIKLALEGLLEPDKKEEVLATVEVRETFKVPKVGTVAGCYVADGKISRNNKVRLIRDGLVIFEGNINALKRFKDDVKEVEEGFECGISLENFNDIKVGDVIEAYTIIEMKRKLQ
ncbi:MAG: translation initiation factor IF-2 [Ignavibacteria bacterium]|nr:translation initiation factor IF-2 [Ignavibacteria bacterium]